MENFNTALAQMGDAIRSASSQSGEIARYSHEISTSIDELAKRTEQRAASLEETAAAIERITSASPKTAENATHVSTKR